MTPMPHTRRDIAAIPARNVVMMPVISLIASIISLWLCTVKVALSVGLSHRYDLIPSSNSIFVSSMVSGFWADINIVE